MSFGLKNAPTIFSKVVVEVFKEFLHKFMEAYFDYWIVFSLFQNHIECLRLILDKCRQYHISLNLKKFIFFSPFGVLPGHIVCKQRLLVDPSKISIIVDFPLLLQSNNCALCWDILDTIGSSLKDMHKSQQPWRRF
jgi:hypothetical protein